MRHSAQSPAIVVLLAVATLASACISGPVFEARSTVDAPAAGQATPSWLSYSGQGRRL